LFVLLHGFLESWLCVSPGVSSKGASSSHEPEHRRVTAAKAPRARALDTATRRSHRISKMDAPSMARGVRGALSHGRMYERTTTAEMTLAAEAASAQLIHPNSNQRRDRERS
jgi:hypothetical protein